MPDIRFSIAAVLLFVTAPSPSQTDPNHGKVENPFGQDLVDRIMDTDLPFTGGDSDLRFDLHPKISDIVREPYIRLPIDAIYGFTENREGSLGIIPYIANPFDSDPIDSLGYFTFGVKQRVEDVFSDKIALALGFNAKLPLDDIPSDLLRDRYDAYEPFLVGAYQFDEEWLAFSSFRYQLVGKDRRSVPTNDPDPPSLAIFAPGVIYQPPGDLRYSFALEFKTDRYDGGADDGLKVIPGITWFPATDTPFFRNIAGHFELTLNIEYALYEIEEEIESSDIGVSLDIRWRLNRRRSEAQETVLP